MLQRSGNKYGVWDAKSGMQKARKYTSQVCNELSARVMVRQKDIVNEAFIEEIA